MKYVFCDVRDHNEKKMRKSKGGMEREESVAAGTPDFPRSKWTSINISSILAKGDFLGINIKFYRNVYACHARAFYDYFIAN